MVKNSLLMVKRGAEGETTMSESYLPWLSGAFGLIGALIGAAASVLTVYFQTKLQDQRALLRHAAELARADYKLRVERAPPGTQFPPVSVFLAYEVKLLNLIEKGKLNPASFRRLSAEQDKLLDTAFAMAAERGGPRPAA
jgi:hypothetical protein